jgi:hypothetical protein
MATIGYIRHPTPALYVIPSIFLCTFSNHTSESLNNNFEFASNGVPDWFAFFLVEMPDVVLLAHDDGMDFLIPLKYHF